MPSMILGFSVTNQAHVLQRKGCKNRQIRAKKGQEKKCYPKLLNKMSLFQKL